MKLFTKELVKENLDVYAELHGQTFNLRKQTIERVYVFWATRNEMLVDKNVALGLTLNTPALKIVVTLNIDINWTVVL